MTRTQTQAPNYIHKRHVTDGQREKNLLRVQDDSNSKHTCKHIITFHRCTRWHHRFRRTIHQQLTQSNLYLFHWTRVGQQCNDVRSTARFRVHSVTTCVTLPWKHACRNSRMTNNQLTTNRNVIRFNQRSSSMKSFTFGCQVSGESRAVYNFISNRLFLDAHDVGHLFPQLIQVRFHRRGQTASLRQKV